MEKTLYVENLLEGDTVAEIFVIKAMRQGETRTGKPYLLLTLMDKSGEISCPIWNDVAEIGPLCSVGAFVRVSGTVGSFREQLQLQVESLELVAGEEVDLAHFLPETMQDRQQLAAALGKYIGSIEDPWLQRLLQFFFGKGTWWRRFKDAPAAKGAHHACVGGLLEHTLSIVSVADSLARHYPGVNRSLLLAGALLHDIGKLEEMQFQGPVVEYTAAGRLKGHLVIGSEMVADAAASIEGFPAALLEQLQHLILSHHGRLEYGSPVLPMTVEAFLLSMVDDMDAKMNMIEQLRRKMAAGKFSFTEYQRLLERYLYLSGYEENEDSRPDDAADIPRRNQLTLFS